MTDDVLLVQGLRVNFYTYDGVVKAIDGVELNVRPRETIGLVGETGCGKSVTVNSVVKLIPMPPGKIEGGRALLRWPLRCPDCRGKGCETCGGSGTRDVCETCAGEKRCVRCRGHGRYKDGKGCTRCEGTGRCAACGGTGGRYVDLLGLSAKALREVRGDAIALILQEPMSALNPVLMIAEQIGESFYYHQRKSLAQATLATLDREIRDLRGSRRRAWRLAVLLIHRRLYRSMVAKPESLVLQLFRRIPLVRRYHKWIDREARARSLDALRTVRIPSPENVLNAYPHELSGGMMQRVVIAIALAGNPKVLVADEPTTALDVTIQSQILRLMQELKADLGTGIIFITHDLAVIAQVCDRVNVMYAGTIAESASVADIFANPLHPYTRGLIGAIPRPHEDVDRLSEIPGNVPNLVTPPDGCRFHPRCVFAKAEVCAKEKPLLVGIGPDHRVACHMYNHNAHRWSDEERGIAPKEVAA